MDTSRAAGAVAYDYLCSDWSSEHDAWTSNLCLQLDENEFTYSLTFCGWPVESCWRSFSKQEAAKEDTHAVCGAATEDPALAKPRDRKAVMHVMSGPCQLGSAESITALPLPSTF